MRSWDDLSRQVKVLSEVLKTFVGQCVEVPLPAELSVDEAFGGQGLHSLDDVQVSNFKLGMLDLKVLLSNEGTVLEEGRVDRSSVFLWDDHWEMKAESREH